MDFVCLPAHVACQTWTKPHALPSAQSYANQPHNFKLINRSLQAITNHVSLYIVQKGMSFIKRASIMVAMDVYFPSNLNLGMKLVDVSCACLLACLIPLSFQIACVSDTTSYILFSLSESSFILEDNNKLNQLKLLILKSFRHDRLLQII